MFVLFIYTLLIFYKQIFIYFLNFKILREFNKKKFKKSKMKKFELIKKK